MTASAAFARFAEAQISAPRKRAICAAERRTLKRARRAQVEKSELFGLWTYYHAQRRKALLAGPHGGAAQELVDLLGRLTPECAGELIKRVEGFKAADADTRAVVLMLADNAIVRMRESLGEPPFCDPYPGEPPNLFLVLRRALE
jgi:hypothetical protein